MQRRYKGTIIPTYEELLEYTKKGNYNEGAETPNLVYEVQGINVAICSLEEAEKIKDEYGNKGINEKIDQVIVDFIDNVLDAALSVSDSVKEMQDSVNSDPTKQFKLTTEELRKKMEEKAAEEDTTEEKTVKLEREQKPKDSKPVNKEFKTREFDDQAEDNDESYKLTDEDVEAILNKADEKLQSSKDAQLSAEYFGESDETSEEVTSEEEGEYKMMDTSINPNTGEVSIIGNADSDELDSETFEEMYDRIANSDIDFGTSDPISKDETLEYLAENPDGGMLGLTAEDLNVSPENIQEVIKIANRRKKKENFGIYQALPDELKEMIDKYVLEAGISPLDKRSRALKNTIATDMIDEFINNIESERIKKDFNVEVESIFNKAYEEIGDSIAGYTKTKLEKYREAAAKMTDLEKKEKMNTILDQIQEAHDLNTLKEYAKHCKIKKFDFEKPGKYFDRLKNKYKDTPYSIYDINLCAPILYRNINELYEDKYTDKDIIGFLIAYCKQTSNMQPSNIVEHSYMYYVIYNIVLADLTKSEKDESSKEFFNNVVEVIDNLKKINASMN